MTKAKFPSILLSAVPIGLGHMRAAQPIDQAAKGRVVLASTLGSEEEKKLWLGLTSRYELLSRITSIPFFSYFALKLLDRLQDIPPLEEGKDLSKPTLQVKILAEMIQMGLGKEIVNQAKKSGLPFVTTFYALSLAADMAGLKRIFCIIPDTQVNRAWVSLDPERSNIIYFVPVQETIDRLKAYGVPENHIYLTGFPLPRENVENAGADLKARLKRLGEKQPLNVTFSIGGAGAQTDICLEVIKSLLPQINSGKIIFNLSCGVRPQVKDYFERKLERNKVNLFYSDNFKSYFNNFNKLLRQTDILFTKPSELSFFCALGLPMVLTPSIGPHERYNKAWLEKIGACIDYHEAINNFSAKGGPASGWDDLLASGRFSQLAKNGFNNASREGTAKIVRLLRKL